MKKWLYNHGEALTGQMKTTVIPEEGLGIWYLGQETFLLKKGNKFILIDPYLTDYVDRFPEFEKGFWVRKYHSPVKPEDMDFIDFILCTHNHLDHMDPDTIRGVSSCNDRTGFVVPYPDVNDNEKLLAGKNIIYGAKVNEPLQFGELNIIPVPAAHGIFHRDNDGNYCELSYLIKWGNFIVFHGGDMKVYPELPDILKGFDIDIAFLPINGGDWLRDKQGIVGNMNFREAADLGVEIGADLIVPIHFDLYDVNQENPAYFIDYIYHSYPGQKYHIFQPGERMIYFKER